MLAKFLKSILLLILIIFISVVGGFFYVKHYLQQMIQTPKVLYIPKGSTKSVMQTLQKNGLDISKLDYYLVKLIGYPQAGWVDLQDENMTRARFLQRITHAKAALKNITLIPGETKEIFFRQMAQKLDLNTSRLIDAYNHATVIQDGVIIADTYKIPMGISENDLIKYLLDKSFKKHTVLSQKYLHHYDPKEWFGTYITTASVIQKEAANVKEMPLVSAVIHNRLKRKMKLQMDGTLNYKEFSHVKVTAKRIDEDNSSYNTYKIAGLPPVPVCAVSTDAIEAALKPADVPYLYFVKGKDNKHHFTTTYKAHLKAIPKH